MIGIRRLSRLVLIGLPFAWLGLFFLLPLLIILKISLARSAIGIPPYTPLFYDDGGGLKIQATLANFALLASDDLYLRAYLGALGRLVPEGSGSGCGKPATESDRQLNPATSSPSNKFTSPTKSATKREFGRS